MKINIFKKITSLFLIFTVTLNFLWVTFAANSSWNALDNFTKRQYSLLFESDLSNKTSTYWDIFDISKKLDMFNTLSESIKKSRENVEKDNTNILLKITNLESTKKQIEEDIKNIIDRIKDISLISAKLKSDIEITEKKISNLKKQIDDNKKVLLEYLDYMLKKWNTAYNWIEIDNLKSIILNNEDISNLIDDLYFNSLIQVAWKRLIEKHMKYVWDLYLEKVNIENQQVEYWKLRKQLIIEQNNLKEKKEFQEKLLEISKNRQEEYQKIIKEKLKTENRIKEIALKQEKKIEEIKTKILSENGCSFVDFSKDEKAKEDLQKNNKKCYDINNILYLESQLNKNPVSEKNPMIWPVNPTKWISAYFRDPSYKAALWWDHNAIDIPANQGTDIKAPMSWYVIYINPPTTKDYSFLALKHPNWFTTVYWHLSEIWVKQYEYVEKWQIIWKSWWERWTNWAWFLSSWAHLHFEVFRNKEYIDPLDVLDMSYLKYNKLPANPPKYKLKYLMDFKNRRWFDYSDSSSKTFILKWNTELERQKYLINKYASSSFKDYQLWIDQSLIWNIDPSVTMCIWLAESWLWRNLTTSFNIWNVWNNDRWDRVWLWSAKEWIYSIVKTLNNRYFKNVNRIDMLSWAWRIASNLPNCGSTSPCYATDRKHWHPNVITCLSHLKWRIVEDDYNFRISK